jgi:hypothetical protein
LGHEERGNTMTVEEAYRTNVPIIAYGILVTRIDRCKSADWVFSMMMSPTRAEYNQPAYDLWFSATMSVLVPGNYVVTAHNEAGG